MPTTNKRIKKIFLILICFVSILGSIYLLIPKYRKITKMTNELTYSDDSYTTIMASQGSCTDGENIYYYLVGKDSKGATVGILKKYNIASASVTLTNSGHYYNHGNDMCYNSTTGKLYIANMDGTGTISVVNPDTLAYESTINVYSVLNMDVAAITYNSTLNKYAIIMHDCYDNTAKTSGHNDWTCKYLAIFNSDFELEKKLNLPNTDMANQGIECDEKYIYVLYANGSGDNYIYVYDWNGKFINSILCNANLEIESLCKINDTTFYSLYNSSNYHGGLIYKLTVSSETTIPVIEILSNYQLN